MKGSPGQWVPDMELMPTTILIPRWLKRWLDRQPEGYSLLFERAVISWGAEPPSHVKECLKRRKAADEEKIRRKAAALERAKVAQKFTLE